MFLKSGDVLVLSGGQRAVFHGVPRILPGSFAVDAAEAADAALAHYAAHFRVNYTVRQVHNGSEPRDQAS